MSNHSATTVSNPSAINTQAKDMLARILAGENLIVEHNPKAHTAMFDTKSRVLTLPVWDNMSESMYDMLIGHEVGHALYTPWTERDEAANGIAAAFDIGGQGNAEVAMDYLNVVEDARIERMVQDKFPGLRRDFFTAYGEMVKSDFFGLNGTNINDLPLLDRLNIHFKLGTQAPQQIIFTPDEQAFIDRISKSQSFDDTVDIATDLFAHCGNKRNDEKRKEFVRGEMTPAPSNGGDQDDNGTVTAQGDGQSDDAESQGSGKQKQGDEQSDKTDDKAGVGNIAGDKMTQTPARSKTQQAIDAKLKQHRSKCTGVHYGVLDTPNLDNIVWDYTKVAADLAAFDARESKKIGASNPYGFHSHMRSMTECFNSFITESAPLINNMVKQFEMRKAADKAKRTASARSGVLDTVRMMNYRLTDDIFRRNAIVTDGKNHGLVMYIDWSSSMSGVLLNTVKQMLILTQFCRKVNIPFEVYAFSSVPMNPNLIKTGDYGTQVSESSHYWTPVKGIGNAKSAQFQAFSLINLMSSRMKGNEYKTGLLNAFRIGYGASSYSPIVEGKYMLGSTPLDECIVAAMDMVPKFRDANKLQIVNTVFLTDGDSTGNRLPCGSNYYNSKAFIIDPATRKTYENNGTDYCYGKTTSTLLRMFRDRTKTNAIGFFLVSNKTLNTSSPWYVGSTRDENAYVKAAASYADNGFAESLPDYNGYTVQYIIRSLDMDVVNENVALSKLDAGGATVAQVTRALAKDAALKNKSKLMLNRFIDLIAKA